MLLSPRTIFFPSSLPSLLSHPSRLTGVQRVVSLCYLPSVPRVRTSVDTTPSTDEDLILYFSIDSSTVRTRLEGGSGEARDVDAGVEETRGQM